MHWSYTEQDGENTLNLKAMHKEKLADAKKIGGRGRLSDSVIKKVQRYYGFAIRQNVLKVEMKCFFFVPEFERAAKIRKIAVYRFLISLLAPEL